MKTDSDKSGNPLSKFKNLFINTKFTFDKYSLFTSSYIEKGHSSHSETKKVSVYPYDKLY